MENTFRAGHPSISMKSGERWERLPDGGWAHRVTLVNGDGCRVTVTDYGATVTSMMAPDRDGVIGEVALGFNDLESYLRSRAYFGCTVGRYANRIREGRFTLDGVEHNVTRNHGRHHLHGGLRGFDKVLWRVEEADESSVALSYRSVDGEEGYSGQLNATVCFSLTDRDELEISYKATTDRPTIINLTNHTYFNLAGVGDVLGHVLELNADSYTPADEDLLPSGEVAQVKGTPLDFFEPKKVGRDIGSKHAQMLLAGGYDHNYVLRGSGLRRAATLSDPMTGRVMDVRTTQPGLQLYTGNFLDGAERGRWGEPTLKHSGLCLETQHYPDSPNHPHFPSTVLRPGETYNHRTVLRFTVM